jgi:peptidoglycan/LPS O-acetylase OafA/YrhL
LLAAFLVSVYLSGIYGDMGHIVALKLPSTILGLSLAVWCCRVLEGEKAQKFLFLVGTISMSIYVMHIMVLSAVRVLMKEAGVPELPALYYAVGLVAGLSIPTGIHFFLKKKNLLWLFGFAPCPFGSHSKKNQTPVLVNGRS